MRRNTFPGDLVDPAVVEQVSTGPAFEELFHHILRTPPSPPGAEPMVVRGRQPLSRRYYLLAGMAALVVLGTTLSIVLATGGGGLTKPLTTPFHASTPFTPSAASGLANRSGQWQLVGAVLSGSWTQNTYGPPAGYLSCASSEICYVLSGKYASPDANAPLLSESLYVTQNLGTSWSVFPMPKSFDPSTALSCPAALTCGVGGALNGQPVFLLTTDGGSQWTISPLIGLQGELVQLVCSSARTCHGIDGSSFVSTTDAGKTWWPSSSFPGVESVYNFACADAAHCIVLGASTTEPPYFVGLTSDGGGSWTTGVLPKDFTFSSIGGISCADASHCLVDGWTASDNSVGAVSQVISTTNGGRSWIVDSLPSDVPDPQLSGISCPSTTECWASGSEAVAEHIGSGTNADSSVLLGTTNSGARWSKVVFTVPNEAPDAYGQSYLSIGQVACPSTNACIALGVTAQSSPTSPVYTLVSQPSA